MLAERQQRAAMLYEGGMSLRGVAEAVGVSHRAVLRDLKAMGVERREPGRSRVVLDARAIELYLIEGWTLERIAAEYDMAVSTVWLRLAENGVSMRRRGFGPEVGARISAAMKGKKRGPFSPEHRANIALALQEFWDSPASRARRAERSERMQAWWETGAGAALIAIEKASGSARRTWKLRWTRSPGRTRSYTDEQAAWVLSLASQGYGHARIAETVGLHRDTVRRIRARQKRS